MLDFHNFKTNQIQRELWQSRFSSTHTPSEVFKYITSELKPFLTAKDASDLYSVFMKGMVIPAGRIIATFAALMDNPKANFTPFNCFVNPFEEDSITGIFQCAKETAKTYSWGGGVGNVLSSLRPEDSPVNNVASKSTGAWSFLELFNSTTNVIGQRGRRGASLQMLHVEHPDIENFITAKGPSNLKSMNLSVAITERFMLSLHANKSIQLWYPERSDGKFDTYTIVPYISSCYDHPTETRFYVESDGSFRFRKVFKEVSAKKIWELICKNAWEIGCPGIIFWDKMNHDPSIRIHGVNPCGEEPLPPYGACNLASPVLSRYISQGFDEKLFTRHSKLTGKFLDGLIDYAAERGLFPLEKQKESALKYRPIGVGIMGLADAFILQGMKYGSFSSIHFTEKVMRLRREALDKMPNSQKTTAAPTGTISLLMGCSPGIEPNFSYLMDISVGNSTGGFDKVRFEHPILSQSPKKSLLLTAHDIPWEARLKVQQSCQLHTDASISSTVNLPKDTSIEDISKIYFLAHEYDLKGVTIFREGSQPGALSKVGSERSNILTGKTCKIPSENSSWYVTVNFADDHPCEVFVNAGKSGSNEKAWTEAVGRLSSLYLQTKEGNADKIVKSLIGIHGSQTFFSHGWTIQSGPDAIAKAISCIIMDDGKGEDGEICPECRTKNLHRIGGCSVCLNCGYSKCD